jgi:hypothetical protein
LADADIREISETISMDDLRTKVGVKWGWYDRIKKLFKQFVDEHLQDKIGEFATELDFSWGSPVVTESQAMACSKAETLLKHLSGGTSRLDGSGPLSWARLELGDFVEVDAPFVRSNIYQIWTKGVTMTKPYRVTLGLVRFLGEDL